MPNVAKKMPKNYQHVRIITFSFSICFKFETTTHLLTDKGKVVEMLAHLINKLRKASRSGKWEINGSENSQPSRNPFVVVAGGK